MPANKGKKIVICFFLSFFLVGGTPPDNKGFLEDNVPIEIRSRPDVALTIQKLRLLRGKDSKFGERHPQKSEITRLVLEEEAKLLVLTGAGARIEPVKETMQPNRTETIKPSRSPVFLSPKSPTETFEGKTLVSSKNFQLIGGWRIPPAPHDGKSMAYSQGGFAFENLKENNVTLWMPHHAHLTGVVKFQGGDHGNGAVASWPLLVEKEYHSLPDDFPRIGSPMLAGIHYSRLKKLLWVSGRSTYAVPPHMGPWLLSYGLAGSRLLPIGPFNVESSTVQQNGGGFVEIPKQFADRYLGGRTLGLACGGYESGQGCSLGPTLVATFDSTDVKEIEKGRKLIGFGFDSDPNNRENRPDDYNPAKLGWAIPPSNGVGFWFSEEILGGPAWVETQSLHGLIYFVNQGFGDLDYGLQNDTFTIEKRTMMYVYSIADIAMVAEKKILPNEIRARYEIFPNTKDLGIPRGAIFDVESSRLFVFLQNAWKAEVESMPAIAIFEVVEN